jgi:hypothetical protein
MTAPRAACLALLAAALAACATTPQPHRPPDAVGGAISQPLRDLSLLRETPVERLRRADAAPYALAPGATCDDVVIEIAGLDAVLGPDIDTPEIKNSVVGDLASSALRGAVSLPFRGVVRAVSGAEKRDRVARRAAVAGVARRSFLKGVARAKGCAS